MLVPELTAEADHVLALQPGGVVAVGEVLAVPHTTAGALGVDVNRHQPATGAFGTDLYRGRGSRDLRERRNRLPLPPVPQPVEMGIRGQVGGQAAGGAEREKPWLGRYRTRGDWDTFGIALD